MLKRILVYLATLFLFSIASGNAESSDFIEKKHIVNFSEVKIKEFIKFVSKVCKKNFIFKDHELDFIVSFISGTSSSEEKILKALKHILFQHHFKIIDHDDYYLIEKMNEYEIRNKTLSLSHKSDLKLKSTSLKDQQSPYNISHNGKFHFYKLQYHVGNDILKVIKQIAGSQSANQTNEDFIQAVNSLQWIDTTNSLVFTSNLATSYEILDLIKSLDKPQKQVFIEVLVLETRVKDNMEFGLEWAGKGSIDNKLNFGIGNFQSGGSTLGKAIRSITPGQPSNQTIPLGKGFDLGVIGDLIFHKGKSFASLASLISALQRDGKASVVLNQKILTQDNKSSTIFVGDNIPFTGSVIETVGAAQQTSSNIEYRDVGVSLSITPLLGDGDVITLDIKEEITEAREDLSDLEIRLANGIITSKTNMVTKAHVPDKNFLVLSGMVKNSKTRRKTGIPCLGGLPLIGAAFSKTKIDKEKKNIIVFVRPHIIHNFEDYRRLSQKQEASFEKDLDKKDFEFIREKKSS